MRLRAVVWRAHHPRWAFDPASGQGAARHGGRFNRVGIPVLHTSMRFETAWHRLCRSSAQPMTLCGYDVGCKDIADLTDAATLAALGADRATLARPWEFLAAKGETPPAWALSDRCIAAGHAGILAPSFAPGAAPSDVNAIFWRWTPGPPRKVKVIDDAGRLPKDDASRR